MENNKYTFWQFLKEKKIVIPIIQRDYAQGRVRKEYIRKNFLEQLGKTLGFVPCKEDEKTTELDFVYGTEFKVVGDDHYRIEEIQVLPLDGQQRITTLWLLYWYIAFKAQKLSGSVSEQLMRFSYETRTSSREFCKLLCNLKYSDCDDIVSYIKRQKWFYSSWIQDPTIKAMLRMLSGDKEISNINDGLEKLFKNHTDFVSYWEILIKEDCPIYFNFLPLQSEKLPISDDLYIKMNARGKSLTDFENFKADLIDWIYKDENKSVFETDERRALFASKLDNEWTDFFWNPELGKVDEVFFAFINRFFYNELIMVKNDGGKYVLNENNFKTNRFYSYLNDTEHERDSDSKISYTSFSNYEFYKGNDNCNLTAPIILNLEVVLNRLCSCRLNWNSLFQIDFHKKSFILPEYQKDVKGDFITIKNNADVEINQVTFINQSERVVFYGVCRYLEQGEYDEISFTRWMRFVYNIAFFYNDNNGAYIRTIGTMQNSMALLDSVDPHNIYFSLANHEKFDVENCKPIEVQFNEEIDKAKKIIQDATFELKIQDAEKLPFFKGSIRCLFTNENGEVCDSSWEDYDIKFANAQKMFCDHGLTNEYKRGQKLANRIFLSYCRNWLKQIQSYSYHDKFIFGYTQNVWHNNILLLMETYAYPVHHLLMGEDIDVEAPNKLIDPDKYRIKALDKLVNSDVIEAIQDPSWIKEPDKVDKFYVRWLDDNRKFSLYPSSTGIMLNSEYRDGILSDLENKSIIQVEGRHSLNTTGRTLYYDWNVEFFYGGYKFIWQNWNWIDMYDENSVRIQDQKDFKDLCIIDVNPQLEKNSDSILNELNRCVESYKNARYDLNKQ